MMNENDVPPQATPSESEPLIQDLPIPEQTGQQVVGGSGLSGLQEAGAGREIYQLTGTTISTITQQKSETVRESLNNIR